VLNENVELIEKNVELASDLDTARTEQSKGIEQIRKTLPRTDEVTPQNSALMEEIATSAKLPVSPAEPWASASPSFGVMERPCITLRGIPAQSNKKDS